MLLKPFLDTLSLISFTFNSVDGMEITIGDDANTLDLYFYNSNLDENQLTSIYNTIYGGK